MAQENIAHNIADNRKFEDLVKLHHQQAYHLAYRMAGNDADAEDLVQEAFIRAYRFFNRYNPAQPFAAWLYRIMTNVYIDELRKRKRNRTISLDDPIKSDKSDAGISWDVADPNADTEAMVLSQVFEEDLQKALQLLSPEFRMAVILADIEGLSYEEIADAMRSSIGTVRSRIHRARKQMRLYLEKIKPEWKPKSLRG